MRLPRAARDTSGRPCAPRRRNVGGVSTAPVRNRLFLAADLDGDDRRRLASLARRVAAATGGRPVGEDGLHVTLHFLGAVAAEAVPPLVAALEREAGGPAVTVAGGPLRAWPCAARARLVALELRDLHGGLAALAARLAPAVARALGEAPPPRPLWAHVTLVRLRRPGAVEPAALPREERTFGISRAALYDSRQTPGGPPRYVRVAGITLGTIP